MKPETKLKRKIVNELKKIPYSTWHIIQAGSIRGTADIIGCCAELHCEFEVKNSEKRVYSKREALQKRKLIRANISGGVGMFLTAENWQQIVKALKERAEKWQPKKIEL